MNDKKTWYDGHFYDTFIAPNQDRVFQKIKELIPKDSTVLDLGCGTGRLLFQLLNHCKNVTGIDLSLANINVAKSKLKSDVSSKISFIHADFNHIISEKFNKYDYAVLSYVIHEIPEDQRLRIIENVKKIAGNIIISDYIAPVPNNLWGSLTKIVEYFAGKEHYKNFKNYVKNGGLEYIVKLSDLIIIREFKDNRYTSHVALLASKS